MTRINIISNLKEMEQQMSAGNIAKKAVLLRDPSYTPIT